MAERITHPPETQRDVEVLAGLFDLNVVRVHQEPIAVPVVGAVQGANQDAVVRMHERSQEIT